MASLVARSFGLGTSVRAKTTAKNVAPMAVRKINVHKIRRSQRRRHKGARCSLDVLRLVGFFIAVFLLAEPFCVGELTCVLSGKGTASVYQVLVQQIFCRNRRHGAPWSSISE